MSENETQETIYPDNKSLKINKKPHIKWIKMLMNSRLIDSIDYKEFENYDNYNPGDSGVVLKAQWKMNNNKKIILKQIVPNEVLDQSEYEELTKEVEALRLRKELSAIQIGSKNVIEFFGISMNSENENSFLVLEYAELGNLREYLRENTSNWEQKVNIARQVTSGLYYLHKNEILHRDLHSENIVVKGDNNQKDGIRALITDFGTSNIISHQSLSRWGIKNECIRFMDPVILTNTDKKHGKMYDYSSDIYSLGIIMWDISNNGKKIFENANDNEAVLKITIKQEREKPVYGSTHSYVELYFQCWDNNPKYRPKIESVYKMIHEDDIVSGKLWEENTSKIEHNQFLGNRIVHPIENEENLENLILIEIQLRKEVEDIEEISNVGFGLVDKQEVFIITLLPGTKSVPAKIPSAFHKYPILIHYGIVKAFCVPNDFHDLLELGISIGNDKEDNACTLGLITQFKTNSEKKYILTTKHGVGSVNDLVCQPGKLDIENGNIYPGCAKVTKYNHLDIDQDNHIIDYAFCEIIDDRRVKSIPNELCILSTTIGSFNLSVNGERLGTFLKVHKVGRTTSHTTAKLHDYWVECKFNWFSTPRKIQVLKVYSAQISFGTYGDSGSPIFDQDNKLVGILHSGIEYQENYSEVYIIPIKLIIEHMRNTFGIEFDLI
ncbi:39156_t:CDS:2 [Gigaspora margarita]|uniref:39156_t:CDS:1 n=1 Tax=Gigaspora margarita TaxID=4874 RepID=A0ABN7V096_GIGMA|nr:39156_t:CDS:2 [Gigaspora margarita]